MGEDIRRGVPRLGRAARLQGAHRGQSSAAGRRPAGTGPATHRALTPLRSRPSGALPSAAMERPLDREEYERWRAEASRALRHGELAAEDGLHNWACFSAEQSAQLAVKGLLHGLGLGPWGATSSLSHNVSAPPDSRSPNRST